ncbi:MAG: LysR family transcriptional regulator [Ramlibacter sp.]|jgi:LysR family transcriptional regulator of gallate degradation|nr:LysR family transcriptional regulator [Ramlibacter sp.]MDB5914385.1 LysR family transcriptional regulator [Ramlibacter sp.]
MAEKNNLRYLRSLLAVTESGSVSKAADRVLRASSAVARSIRELEADLGVPLFERQPGGMRLTPFGELAYRRAKRMEVELDAARAELVGHGASATAPVFGMLVGERHLTTLVRLREIGHMPSVAAAMGMSQPAVSAILRQVETSTRVMLFHRSSKRMAPTEAGEVLLFRVRRALSELRYLQADIALQRGQMAGQVRFAALPSARTLLLPRAIGELIDRHPGVQLAMVDAPFEVLFAGVQSGEIDFILTGISPEYIHRDLRVQVIGREGLGVVARAGHPLATRTHVDVRDLVDYPWLLRDPGAPTREVLTSMFQRMGVPLPQVAVESGDLALLRGVLMHSNAVSAVPPEQLSYEIASGQLKVLPVRLPDVEREVGFVLRKDARPSSLCEALMKRIGELAGSLAPGA